MCFDLGLKITLEILAVRIVQIVVRPKSNGAGVLC